MADMHVCAVCDEGGSDDVRDALAQTVAALRIAMAQWECYADAPRDFEGGPYLANSTDPQDLEAAIYRKCQAALAHPAVRALDAAGGRE